MGSVQGSLRAAGRYAATLAVLGGTGCSTCNDDAASGRAPGLAYHEDAVQRQAPALGSQPKGMPSALPGTVQVPLEVTPLELEACAAGPVGPPTSLRARAGMPARIVGELKHAPRSYGSSEDLLLRVDAGDVEWQVGGASSWCFQLPRSPVSPSEGMRVAIEFLAPSCDQVTFFGCRRLDVQRLTSAGAHD